VITTVPTGAKGRPGWERRALTLAKFVVSAGLLAYLVHKGGVAAIGKSLKDATPKWLIGGFVLGEVGAGLTIWQWWGVLRALGLKRRYRRCVRLELAGDVFDAALPSSIGGDVLRAVMVAEAPSERELGVASVVIRRLCNFPGMVVLMSLGALGTLAMGDRRIPWPAALTALGVGLCLVAMILSPLARWVSSIPLMQRSLLRPVANVLRRVDSFRLRRRALVLASLRGCAFWCCTVFSQWCYMHAVGADHVPLAYAAVVVTVTNMVTMLPIALGGYGLRESTFSALLASAGMASVAQGVAVGACLTGQTVIFGLTGLPVYLGLRARARRHYVPAHAIGSVRRADVDLTGLVQAPLVATVEVA
jgi:uncharacterized protein (TIRG00374 family)